MTAIIIRTGDGRETGILLSDETLAFPPENGVWTLEEGRAAFRAALEPDTLISADCFRGKRTLRTDSGAQIAAHEAQQIRMTGRLLRGAAATRDGTRLNVLEDGVFSCRTYQLADGTELLRVNAPRGPQHSYVGGTKSFDALSEAAQEQVAAFYDRRGLLYDEQEVLEEVWALYRQLGTDFRSGLVEQSVSPSASGDGVLYFLTAVTLPTGRENGNNVYEVRLCDAFDRETGAHIDTWELFAAPRETVIKTLLDAGGITDQPLRAEMEAAPWDGHIVFFPDGLSVEFAPGTLTSEPNISGFALDLTPTIRALLQEWAVPHGRD